jgi:hypothetical protein
LARHAVGNVYAVCHRDAFDGNERDYIGRPDAGMHTFVPVHIDQFDSPAGAPDGGIANRFRRPGKSDNRAIVILVHFVIEDENSRHRTDCGYDFADLCRVPALGEVRHALD